MYWTCNDCGETFEAPFYRKNRVGVKIPYCPACGGYDIDEYEEDDGEYEDIVEWEDLTDSIEE